MGIVAVKYHLPSTEKIIKEEKIQIWLPSLCVFSWNFVNIGSFWSNIRCAFPPSENGKRVYWKLKAMESSQLKAVWRLTALINPESAKKKCIWKILSAEVVCSK